MNFLKLSTFPRLLILALLLCLPGQAQQQIKGEIITSPSLVEQGFMLQTAYGSVRVRIGTATEILRDGRLQPLSALKTGEWVDVFGLELGSTEFAASKILSSSGRFQPEADPVPFPRANSSITERRPVIGAGFPFVPSEARFWLDGVEYGPQAFTMRGRRLEFPCQSNLSLGKHHAKVWGVDSRGVVESSEWSFRVYKESKSNFDGGIYISPADRSLTTFTRPTIIASFPRSISSAHVLLDGQQREFSIIGSQLKVNPRSSLSYGPHFVDVWVQTDGGQTYSKRWSFEVSRLSETDRTPLSIAVQSPPAYSLRQDQRPQIGAELSKSVKKSSLKLLVDGLDVTAASKVKKKSILWEPGYDLDFGTHRVQLWAETSKGERIERSWTFEIRR